VGVRHGVERRAIRRLYVAIAQSQDVLARYIEPNSGMDPEDAISDLLEILDHRDLIRVMWETEPELMKLRGMAEPQRQLV
jgi:hypothetical protein